MVRRKARRNLNGLGLTSSGTSVGATCVVAATFICLFYYFRYVCSKNDSESAAERPFYFVAECYEELPKKVETLLNQIMRLLLNSSKLHVIYCEKIYHNEVGIWCILVGFQLSAHPMKKTSIIYFLWKVGRAIIPLELCSSTPFVQTLHS